MEYPSPDRGDHRAKRSGVLARALLPIGHVLLEAHLEDVGFLDMAVRTRAPGKVSYTSNEASNEHDRRSERATVKIWDKYLLLRIVCGVRKNAWKDSPQYPVAAHKEDAVLVRVHEVFVKQEQPDFLHELTLAEAQDGSSRRLAIRSLIPSLHGIGKLSRKIPVSEVEDAWNRTLLIQRGCMPGDARQKCSVCRVRTSIATQRTCKWAKETQCQSL